MTTKVYSTHPNVDTQYKTGISVPASHPPVTFPAGALPSSHPNIDMLLRSPAKYPLPAWHPAISNYVVYGQPAKLSIAISSAHPEIDTVISTGEPLPLLHPSVAAKFVGVVSATHPGLRLPLKDVEV
jgi:hypothetical protein